MIYKRGKNGTYWLRFRFAGRMVHESTHTASKTIARDAERERRRELELSINGLKERRSLPPTLEKAAALWLESRKQFVATSTANIAKLAIKHLLPAFGSCLLCDISPEDIQKYQQRRLREAAQGRTVNIEISTLRQILKANDCWQPLDGKVKMLRERKDVGRALSADEEKRLLEAAQGIDSACYTAIVVGLNTAMRKDEIRNLRWSQIDFERRTLIVGKSKTETGEGRVIPLNATVFETLAHWASRFAGAEPFQYVFPWCENRRVDAIRPTKGWRTAWRHALRIAGFHCRFHDLRHTAISKLGEGQASDQTMMAIAGHVSPRMLAHYSHVRLEAKRKALDGLTQVGVHQNVHQLPRSEETAVAKLLN